MSSKTVLMTALVAATAMGLAALPGTARADLVTNGSFENGSFVDNTGGNTDNLADGSTAITGWTVVAPSNTLAWVGDPNPYGITTPYGTYSLDLTGYHDGAPFSGVTQTITTVINDKYSLTFYLGSASAWGRPTGILASAGSTSGSYSSTLMDTNDWEKETLLFTATSTSTVISLTGNEGDQYIGLDNVSVVQVGTTPLPSTWTMLIAGFLGLGFFAYRGSKKNAAGIAAA
jgi:hypothetical protein